MIEFYINGQQIDVQLENEETPAEFEDNQSLTVEEQDFNEDASLIPLELNESSNEEE